MQKIQANRIGMSAAALASLSSVMGMRAAPAYPSASPDMPYVKPAIPRAQARRLRQMAQGTLTASSGCPCLPGGALYDAFANVPGAF